MKKSIKRFCLALGLCVIFAFCLCGCSSDNSIIGTWTVTSYEVNDKIVNIEDVSEYMGTDFAEIERPTLMFQKSGNVCIYYESGDKEEYTVNYTITDNTIELYSENEHIMYLEIDGDMIRFEEDTIPWIYTKD